MCSACIASGLNQFIKEYLKAKEFPTVKEWIENYGELFYLDPAFEETDNIETNVYIYNHKKSREWIDWFLDVFKDDFYLEFQDHHFPLENAIMDEMVRIRNNEYPNIKIVATCDAHYLNKEDAYVHELFLCNQTKRTIDDPKHMKFSGDGYYVHTSKEMLELFPVEYLDNTLEIEEKIHYEPLNKGYHLPHFPLPEGFKDDNEYFKFLVNKTFKEKFPDKFKNPIYRERIKTEGKTIQSMGWASYFLIVMDFIKWAEDDNVKDHWQEYFPNKKLEEIPQELLKDYKIYCGSGRGCVNPGTLIVSEKGLIPIEEIKIGDKVYTHTGKLQTVLDTYKYENNETLIGLRCASDDYGEDKNGNYGHIGNAYTKNHKIWAIKNENAKNWQFKPEWIEAQDLKVGDFLIQPKINYEEDNLSRFDLSGRSFNTSSKQLVNIIRKSLYASGIPNHMFFEKGRYSVCIPEFINELNVTHDYIFTDGFVAKRITQISEEQSDYVYDIAVENDTSYMTSSFVAHNSGAGSLINACLGITKVDPILYDLSFERFLNPDRISMPDIDTDIEDSQRGKVLDYVRFKYGYDKVANIITFGTCAAKNSIKTINRVLGYNVANGEAITKLIPEKPGMKIKTALENVDFKRLYDTNADAKKIVDLALRIEGLKTSQSIHPCASLITDETITTYMPKVQMEDPETKEKVWVTQMEGPTCEELGCLKMDFLGLRTLGYVHETIENIKQNTGKNVDYDNIPLDDMKVYQYLYEGNTPSVFQCESDMFTTVIKKTLKDYKTAKGDECFDRLVAMNALVRPGSNVFIDDFAERILHPEKIEYLVPQLEPILKNTYGIILYQEQTMRITRDLAGFSAGAADTVRKAMGKKKKYLMDEYREYFIHGNKKKKIKGCVENGISEKKASELWDIMAMASSYSFNKSHAVAYSMHSIRTAWLSYYYPYEYMTAVLNSFSSDTERLAKYLDVARKKGMNILPPSVNNSKEKFTTDGKNIQVGISGIKGINAIASDIIDERAKNGLYSDLHEFVNRMMVYKNFSKRTLVSLIYAGMLDGWCGSRLNKLNQIDVITTYIKKTKDYQKKLTDGKTHRNLQEPILELSEDITEMDKLELLIKEKEYTGMYISGNPMDLFKSLTGKCPDCSHLNETSSAVCGIIQEAEKKVSKKGTSFFTFKLENNGTISGILNTKNGTIYDGEVVKLEGKISKNEFGTNISVNVVENLTETRQARENSKIIYVNIPNKETAIEFKKLKFDEGDKKLVATYKNKDRLYENISLGLDTAEKIIGLVGNKNINFK